MTTIHSIIGSVGIIANLTVVVIFLNHKKFRQKIPNIFIIHQVSEFLYSVEDKDHYNIRSMITC